MPDNIYDRWGITPDAVNSVSPSTSLSVDDFNSRWGVDQAPVAQQPQGPIDKLLGINGPRYQTWPERLARGLIGQAESAATLPGDVYAGRVDPNSDEAIARSADFATLLSPTLKTGGNALVAAAASKKPLTTLSPETAQLAQTARDTYGIPIRGGQMAESRSAKMLDSVLAGSPFSGYGSNIAEQHTAFNRAIAKTFGEDADAVTPEVMAAAKKRIGNKFDEISSRTSFPIDNDLTAKSLGILKEASSVLPAQEIKPIYNQLMSIAQTADKNGVISGDSYQALTRKGAPLDRAINSSDPNVRFYAGQIKDALQDAMERYASPRDARQLREARSQWKSLKTVEDLAEKAPTGDISPALLLGKVRQSYDNFAYGGGGQLGDLARIGQRFMKEPPNSGTADRLWWMKALGMMGAGGEGAMLYHDPMLAAKMGTAAVTSAVGNRLLGQYMKSPGYANRLIDLSLNPPGAPSLMRQALPYAPSAVYAESRPAISP